MGREIVCTVSEGVAQGEVGETLGEGVDWLAEEVTKGEVGEGGGEFFYRTRELGPKGKVGEGGREKAVHWEIEVVAKDEVGKEGKRKEGSDWLRHAIAKMKVDERGWKDGEGSIVAVR